MDKAANRNTFWAHILVEELCRAGLSSVVIAPGSRSTPLALAFGNQPGLSVFVHPDERGAAFFALGLGLASGRPAAILCTSGTAAVNFYPAVVEASQSEVPLLVITADRPPELRDSGSNQTIDQVKLFGGYVRWAIEAPIPEKDPPETTLRALQSIAGRAFALCMGVRPGPVHINLPFRKPLEPTPLPGDIPDQMWDSATGFIHSRPNGTAYVNVSHGSITASQDQIARISAAIQQARQGLIYCGPRCPRSEFAQAVYRLAQITGFPIFADPLSGLRFSPYLPTDSGLVLGGYETFLKNPDVRSAFAPDLILQFGAVPTSTSLGDALTKLHAARRIVIQETGAWSDDAFNTSDFLWADPEHTCLALATSLETAEKPVANSEWRSLLQRADRLTWQALAAQRDQGFFEGTLLMDVLEELAPEDSLFVASSLPVRHLDQFGQPNAKNLHIYANRGASGIDGTIASALGVAAAHPAGRLALVIGDLAFLHDLNSLLALHRLGLPVTIVLINNDGGGIFRRLPVSDYEPLFSKLFVVPHGLKFEHAARLFQLEYQYLIDGDAFRPAFRNAMESRRPNLIEVSTDVGENENARKCLLQRFEQLWKTRQD